MDVHLSARAISELVCRGLSMIRVYNSPSWQVPGPPAGMPKGWFAVLFAIGGIGCFVIAMIQYTFKLTLILASVESAPSVHLPLDTEDQPQLQKGVYVTSSLRGAVKHLRSSAGALAPWRGWWANLFYAGAVAALSGLLAVVVSRVLPKMFARPLADVLACLALARLSLVCTHIMISAPQSKTWVTRLRATPWSSARSTIPALARFAISNAVATELSRQGTEYGRGYHINTAFIVAGILFGAFVTFPVFVALIRVQASLLPESDEAIVALDRSFGADGEVALTFRKALKSVGCAGWKRICKVALKMAAVVTVLTVVLVAVLFVGVNLVMAGAPPKQDALW